jgi:MoaA/NifB/PqqE/SkfB family radical SAM enzyme
MDEIIRDSKKDGSFFFGILGGEPLLKTDVFDLIAKHPDAYFQIFTNGTLLTKEVAEKMRSLANVTPLISVEGDESESDTRRGGENVFQRTFEGIENCRGQGLVTGIATSVCASNIDTLATRKFVRKAIDNGVHYLWYYIYRPVGPAPHPELALDEEQILRLRKFIVETRTTEPIVIVDAYWDHEGRAICPGALGISHHINPEGHVEFCPPLQFSKDNIADNESLDSLFENSAFLADFRDFASKTTPGCVILEHPGELKRFLEKQKAIDTTGRNAGLKELDAMSPLPGHHLPNAEIPEKHWLYKWAKKNHFFGLGGYG